MGSGLGLGLGLGLARAGVGLGLGLGLDSGLALPRPPLVADRERSAGDRESADAGSAAVRGDIEGDGTGTCLARTGHDRDPGRLAGGRSCTARSYQ